MKITIYDKDGHEVFTGTAQGFSVSVSAPVPGDVLERLIGWFDAQERRAAQRRFLARMMKAGAN